MKPSIRNSRAKWVRQAVPLLFSGLIPGLRSHLIDSDSAGSNTCVTHTDYFIGRTHSEKACVLSLQLRS